MSLNIRSRTIRRLLAGFLVLAWSGCSEPLEVDPTWASRPLPDAGTPIDHKMADIGAELFGRNCAACHTIDGEEIIGPDLRGVSDRRTVGWIRGMIANPDSMLRVDTIASRLLTQFITPMLDRELDDARVRAVIEFLWRSDHPKAGGEVGSPLGGSQVLDSVAYSGSDSIR